MNTTEIKSYFAKNFSNIPFVYVGSYDSLPNVNISNPVNRSCLKFLPSVFVLNSSPSTVTNIGHWLAIIVEKQNKCTDGCKNPLRKVTFFDSLAFHPSYYGDKIVSFLNFCSPVWTYNKIRIQDLHSTVCGEHVLFYITCHFHFNMEISDINNTLFSSTNYNYNDRLVQLHFLKTK